MQLRQELYPTKNFWDPCPYSNAITISPARETLVERNIHQIRYDGPGAIRTVFMNKDECADMPDLKTRT